MNRRNFTIAGFFGGLGAFIGKALGYDGTPQSVPPLNVDLVDDPGYDNGYDRAIKVGRKLMRRSDHGWDVYSAVKSDQHQGDPLSHIDDEGNPQYHRTPRLAQPPEDLKRWNADGDPMRLEGMLIVYPRGPALQEIESRLRDLAVDDIRTKEELQVALQYFAWDIGRMIIRQQGLCDGHHGPAPGNKMTDMPDGRRLCSYCLKQEQDNEQLRDGDRNETSFS